MKNETPPACQIYPGDVLKKTMGWSMHEIGGLMMLLFATWNDNNCCLLNDDTILRNITQVSRGWADKKARIMDTFWNLKDGYWHCEFLMKQRLKREDLSKKCSDAAHARWDNVDKPGDADADANADADGSANADAQAMLFSLQSSDLKVSSSNSKSSKKKDILSPKLEEAFQELYSAYGKKVDPKEARIEYKRLCAIHEWREEFTRDLIKNIVRQDAERAKVKASSGFVAEKCTLARWLKHERWDNVYEVDKTATRNEDTGPEEQPDMRTVRPALDTLQKWEDDPKITTDFTPETVKAIIYGDDMNSKWLCLKRAIDKDTTWKLYCDAKGVKA